jgi:type IV pilus assembly protein PilW
MIANNRLEVVKMEGQAFFQSGVSIVEILVVLALSLVLTLGVSQIYLGSKQTYRLQEAQSRLQENGRYAMEVLANDLREIGHKGCRSLPSYSGEYFFSVNALSPPFSDTSANPLGPSVTGYEGGNMGPSTSNQPGWPGVPNSAVTGTDIVNVQFAKTCGGQLQSGVVARSGSSLSIAPTNTCSINNGQVLVLADCSHIEVFRVSTATPVNNPNPSNLIFNNTTNNFAWFLFNHNIDSEVMLYNSHTYYIGLFNNEPSLYRQENSNGAPPQPLVEGIEDMQITYGLDADGDGSANQYFSADNVNNWNQVVAVHIDLLIRSSGDDGQRLSLVTNNPCSGAALRSDQIADGRLRKCFSSTINLRNPQI